MSWLLVSALGCGLDADDASMPDRAAAGCVDCGGHATPEPDPDLLGLNASNASASAPSALAEESAPELPSPKLSDTEPAAPPADAPAAPPEAAKEAGEVIAEPDDEAAFLWDGEVRTFEIEVSEDDLAILDADPVAEEYVPATLRFDGETYADVGLRYKGSIGSFVSCTADGQGLEPAGPKSCPKLSMQVKVNYLDGSRRFYGLNKLQFHAMNQDGSQLRERLGYAMYREMGIASPRTSHARVMVNGELEGLFLLVEEIDGRFDRSRFTEGGTGNLYKELWPIWTDPDVYLPALKTNETSPNLSMDRVTRFAAELEAAEDDEAVVALLDRWMDLRYVMDYIAVDRTILNDDGMFHWYCGHDTGNSPTECGNHNYYWYEERGFDRLWLVPWDLDLTFRDRTGYITIRQEWNDADVVCDPDAAQGGFGGFFGGSNPPSLPPACDRITRAWGTLADEYRAAVRRFLEGPFAKERVDASLDAWAETIAPYVEEAADVGQGPDASRWQDDVAAFRTSVDNLRAAAEPRM